MGLVELADVHLSDGNITAIITVMGTIFVAIFSLLTKVFFDVRNNRKEVISQILPAKSELPRPSGDPAPSLRAVVDGVERSTTIQSARLDLVEQSLQRIETEIHGLRYGDGGAR